MVQGFICMYLPGAVWRRGWLDMMEMIGRSEGQPGWKEEGDEGGCENRMCYVEVEERKGKR